MNNKHTKYEHRVFLTLFLAAITGVCHSTVLAKAQAKVLVIGGAGPSTEITTLLAREFCRRHPDYTIHVPPKSIKHAGSLHWATEQKQIFGRLGRPLNTQDQKAFPTARALPFGLVKVGFAVRKNLGVTTLTLSQFRDIVQGSITNWEQVGGVDKRIILLGREKGESALAALCQAYPFFEEVVFLKTFRKDHDMILALRQVPGAMGFAEWGALSEHDELAVLHIEGFSCGLEVGLVYDVSRENTEAVCLMQAFVKSAPWQVFLEKSEQYAPLKKWSPDGRPGKKTGSHF
jgi:ABC-type phosphate transport system substrate-binding protein